MTLCAVHWEATRRFTLITLTKEIICNGDRGSWPAAHRRAADGRRDAVMKVHRPKTRLVRGGENDLTPQSRWERGSFEMCAATNIGTACNDLWIHTSALFWLAHNVDLQRKHMRKWKHFYQLLITSTGAFHYLYVHIIISCSVLQTLPLKLKGTHSAHRSFLHWRLWTFFIHLKSWQSAEKRKIHPSISNTCLFSGWSFSQLSGRKQRDTLDKWLVHRNSLTLMTPMTYNSEFPVHIYGLWNEAQEPGKNPRRTFTRRLVVHFFILFVLKSS